jgi:hypothetical protein
MRTPMLGAMFIPRTRILPALEVLHVFIGIVPAVGRREDLAGADGRHPCFMCRERVVLLVRKSGGVVIFDEPRELLLLLVFRERLRVEEPFFHKPSIELVSLVEYTVMTSQMR